MQRLVRPVKEIFFGADIFKHPALVFRLSAAPKLGPKQNIS
jgi:hypothetical protein